MSWNCTTWQIPTPLDKSGQGILPDPFPPLGESEIHVWFLDLSDPQLNESDLVILLSTDEQERAARFKFDRDRRQYTFTRGILRVLLGTYLNVAPQSFRFTYNPWGKPSLPTADLHFNVAHSHNFAVLAFNPTRALGVDIERIRPDVSIQNLMQLVFTDTEIQVFSDLPPSHQALAFFQTWTRKEAYIKALGQGLSIPLNTLEVGFDLNSVAPGIGSVGECSLKEWQLMDLWQVEGYAACLCVGQPAKTAVSLHP